MKHNCWQENDHAIGVHSVGEEHVTKSTVVGSRENDGKSNLMLIIGDRGGLGHSAEHHHLPWVGVLDARRGGKCNR